MVRRQPRTGRIPRLGQSITRVYDLSFLNRSHVASTFYDDLGELILNIVPDNLVTRDYVVPGLPNAEDYPIDFRVETASTLPLFVFGIAGRDKARLTTIVLQYLLQHRVEFESLLVFQNQQEIGRRDLARLTNAGGEQVASLNAEDDLARKLRRRAGLGQGTQG